MARLHSSGEALRSPIVQLLARDGIATTAPVYGPQAIAEINAAVDGIFAAQHAKARAYVTVDDIARLELIAPLLGGNMRSLLLSIAPDPVLYHCHLYEIAGNSTLPHIFGESMAGWHRDADSEYFQGNPTHTSIFVYLSDVDSIDGPFEFSPSDPTHWPRSTTPAISVTGAAGRSFAWNRSYFHRAAPNRGPGRRRLFKLSIQPNAFASTHLGNANFLAARDAVPTGDPYFDVLFGRYQGRAAPPIDAPETVMAERIPPTGTIGIPDAVLARAHARARLRDARSWLRDKLNGSAPQAVAYD